MIWIAVDAMGGDEAPRHVVDGAIAATRQFDLGVLLAGPSALIEAELRRHPDADRSRLRLAEAPEVVTMDESPSAALRRKRGASIRVAADAVARRSGGADVIVCDGFTGNVALKISEGLVEVIERLVGEQLSHTMADYAAADDVVRRMAADIASSTVSHQ